MPRHNPISEARDALIAAVAKVSTARLPLSHHYDDEHAHADARMELCDDRQAELTALADAYDALVDAILRDVAAELPGADPFEAECYGAAALAMDQFIGPALKCAADECDMARFDYSAAADAADEAWSNRAGL